MEGQSLGYCRHCGGAFEGSDVWPRTCIHCRRVTYRNPTPVAVLLLPIMDLGGLLVIRRTIEPGRGQMALPGGFIDWNDPTWQHAAARELREETGITVDPSEIEVFRVVSPPDDKVLLVFALGPGIRSVDLPANVATDETNELAVITGPVELAFSAHTEVVRAFFEREGAGTPGGPAANTDGRGVSKGGGLGLAE